MYQVVTVCLLALPSLVAAGEATITQKLTATVAAWRDRTLYKIAHYRLDGLHCFQATVSFGDVEYVKKYAMAGLREGTCSDNGFSIDVPGESGQKVIRVPFVSNPVTFKRMKRSTWEAAKIEAMSFITAEST